MPRTRTGSFTPRLTGVLERAHDERGAAVARRADVEQAERVGHDRRVEHVVDRRLPCGSARSDCARPWRAFFTFTRAKSSRVAPKSSMRRRAYKPKYVGLVAPSRRNRSQSGSSPRSPLLGARKPFGVVSAPTTSATSQKPARICARAVASAVTPDAHAAYDDATCAPFQPSACANVAPDDVAGVAVAHRVGARDELDVAPLDTCVGERGLRGDHAVLDEVASPLAPRVHARAEDRDVALVRSSLVFFRRRRLGAHCHTTYSCSSSS